MKPAAKPIPKVSMTEFELLAFLHSGPKSLREICAHLIIEGRSTQAHLMPLRKKGLLIAKWVPGANYKRYELTKAGMDILNRFRLDTGGIIPGDIVEALESCKTAMDEACKTGDSEWAIFMGFKEARQKIIHAMINNGLSIPGYQ